MGGDMWRYIVALILVMAITASTACEGETTTKITVVNYTDSPICYFHDLLRDAPENCEEIKARDKRTFHIQCTSGGRDDTAGTTALLKAGPSGRKIYEKGARCIDWSDSGGQIVVDQTGSRFVVVDSLPDATSSP